MEEELRATKEIAKKQRLRFENAESEIRDLNREHNNEMEDLKISLR